MRRNITTTVVVQDSQNSGVEAISYLFTLGVQRDPEQSVCSLVQKVGVQHSDFTHITQPDLGRGLPKAFPDLESTQTGRKIRHRMLWNWTGQKESKGFLLFLVRHTEFICTNWDAIEPMTPSCLEATKSMCKLASNDPATISRRRPGATEWRMPAMETTLNSEGHWHHWSRTF